MRSNRSFGRSVLIGRSASRLIASFAAREVLVSTLSIIYNVGKDENEESRDTDLGDPRRKTRRRQAVVDAADGL